MCREGHKGHVCHTPTNISAPAANNPIAEICRAGMFAGASFSALTISVRTAIQARFITKGQINKGNIGVGFL